MGVGAIPTWGAIWTYSLVVKRPAVNRLILVRFQVCPQMENYIVVNTWNNNKTVYSGNLEQCIKYIQGNNIYQMNYSKLILKKIDMGLLV